MKRIRETMSCEKGFTLVELLVVIGIIGILAMMLLPQFGGMRDRARIASCQSNLKNIGTQLEAFFADIERYPNVTEWNADFAILATATCTHDTAATGAFVYTPAAAVPAAPPGTQTVYDWANDTGAPATLPTGGRIDSYLVYCPFHDGTGVDAGGVATAAAETQLFITNTGLERWPQ